MVVGKLIIVRKIIGWVIVEYLGSYVRGGKSNEVIFVFFWFLINFFVFRKKLVVRFSLVLFFGFSFEVKVLSMG